jgi:hypothetical protein
MRRVLTRTRVIVTAAWMAVIKPTTPGGRTYMVTVTAATAILITIRFVVVDSITNGGVAFVIATPNVSAAGNAAA